MSVIPPLLTIPNELVCSICHYLDAESIVQTAELHPALEWVHLHPLSWTHTTVDLQTLTLTESFLPCLTSLEWGDSVLDGDNEVVDKIIALLNMSLPRLQHLRSWMTLSITHNIYYPSVLTHQLFQSSVNWSNLRTLHLEYTQGGDDSDDAPSLNELLPVFPHLNELQLRCLQPATIRWRITLSALSVLCPQLRTLDVDVDPRCLLGTDNHTTDCTPIPLEWTSLSVADTNQDHTVWADLSCRLPKLQKLQSAHFTHRNPSHIVSVHGLDLFRHLRILVLTSFDVSPHETLYLPTLEQTCICVYWNEGYPARLVHLLRGTPNLQKLCLWTRHSYSDKMQYPTHQHRVDLCKSIDDLHKLRSLRIDSHSPELLHVLAEQLTPQNQIREFTVDISRMFCEDLYHLLTKMPSLKQVILITNDSYPTCSFRVQTNTWIPPPSWSPLFDVAIWFDYHPQLLNDTGTFLNALYMLWPGLKNAVMGLQGEKTCAHIWNSESNEFTVVDEDVTYHGRLFPNQNMCNCEYEF